MKRTFVAGVALGAMLAGTMVFGGEDPVTVTSVIRDVTVYADRARVTRVAEVALKKGPNVFAARKLPGWTDEESVRVALVSSRNARILDVRTQREYLASSSDENLAKAERAVQAIADQIAQLDDETRVLDAEAKQIEATRAFSLEKLPRDAAVREIKVADYRAVVDFVSEGLRAVAAKRRELAVKRRELEPELKVRQRQLDEVRGLTQLEQTTILVSIDSDADQKTKLSLTYMLPGATWIAAHELRAGGKQPEKITLASYAIVTQTTGEDWKDANLTFSTQSPAETIRIPELDALLIGDRQAIARLAAVQRGSSFSKAQTVFEGQNVLWFNYNNPNANLDDFKGNWNQQRAMRDRASHVFAELRQRGTTAHFKGEGTPTVRSDGNPIRVPIGEVDLAARYRLVAAPEVSLNVARTVDLTNTGAMPLLPGRTSLFNDGAFLGVTDLSFVAPGESFAVLMGVADTIKLSRVMDRANSSLERGRKTRMEVAFDITVENLSDDPARLALTDRIPVSQNDDIRVYRVDIDPDVDPDPKGLVRWDVKLAAHAKAAFRIEYTVEYPPEALKRMKEARLPAQQAPSAPVQVDLSEQIEALEARF